MNKNYCLFELAISIKLTSNFERCNCFIFKCQNHYNYALLHCFNFYFSFKYFHFKINEPIYYHLITLFKIKFNWFRVQQYFYLLKLAYFKNEISKAFMTGRFENLIIISYQRYWHFVKFFYVVAIVMIFTSFNGVPLFHFNIQKVRSNYSILINYFCCYQRLLIFVD
jgi:hypothetical protein